MKLWEVLYGEWRDLLESFLKYGYGMGNLFQKHASHNAVMAREARHHKQGCQPKELVMRVQRIVSANEGQTPGKNATSEISSYPENLRVYRIARSFIFGAYKLLRVLHTRIRMNGDDKSMRLLLPAVEVIMADLSGLNAYVSQFVRIKPGKGAV